MAIFRSNNTMVKKILNALDEVEASVNNRDYVIIKKILEEKVRKNKKAINKWEESGDFDPLIFVYDKSLSTGVDLLFSGEYHMYRGVLNPMRQGPSILSIVNCIVNKLVEIGDYSKEDDVAIQQHIKEGISNVG